MRNLLSVLALFIILPAFQLTLLAQAPQSFNYQILVIDGLGTPVHDQEIGIRMTILQDNIKVYEEVFSPKRALFGQLSLQVGTGTASLGAFQDIDWSEGYFVIESAVDLNGGSNYTLSRTSPLNSLPYALHANSTAGVISRTAEERDEIINPSQGDILFCVNCGPAGQFQIYNGSIWTDALGQEAQGPILIQSMGVVIKEITDLDEEPEEGTLPLELQLIPENASNKTADWVSDNEAVATVDQQGVVRVIASGDVKITATARDGGGASGSIQLTFEDERPSEVQADELVIVGDTAAIVGDQRLFAALLMPFGEVDSLTSWSSADETLATVDNEGMVNVLAEGRVQIIASSEQEETLRDTFELNIYPNPEEIDLIFPVINIEGYDGENTVVLQRGPTAVIPAAAAEDDKDGAVPVEVNLDLSYNPNAFDSMALAQYRIIYSATDAAGNILVDSVLVQVTDTLAPVISLSDNLVNGDTLYSDNRKVVNFPSATAIDDNGDNIAVNLNQGDFTDAKAGVFCIYFEATDPSNNKTIDSLILINADSIAPVITLSDGSSDGDTLLIPQGFFYELPVATAVDDDGSSVNVLFESNRFDSLTMGYYPLQFQAQDSSGNVSRIEIVARVVDITPPSINNKIALELTSSGFAAGTSDTIGIVEASDNVGIASYEMFWLPVDENWEGTMSIDNNGVIVAGDPNSTAFEAEFVYRIIVRDSIGLKDSVDMRFVYSQGRLRDIRAKEYNSADWIQLGKAYDDPKDYNYTLKEETAIGDTVLFLTAGSNANTKFKQIEFDSNSPNLGKDDFQLIQNGDLNYLLLKNPLNNEVQAVYDFKLNVVAQNRTDTNLVTNIPLNVAIEVQSIRQMVPTLDTIFPTSTYTSSLTVGDLLNPLGNTIEGIACPLSPAHDILSDLGGGLDILIKDLPVIPEKTYDKYAKELINKLPVYFWISKDGRKTRINLKIPVKGKKLRIEYVIDPVKGGCYWAALLDKLKAKDVDSKLEFLDQKTAGGIVVNTVPVNGKDFKCVEIPCLDLNAGAHFVVNGKPLPSTTNGILAEALVSPTVFAVVSPLSNGYSDPALTVAYGLKADFKVAFDKEMVKRLNDASAATRASIGLARQAVFAAEKKVEDALGKLGLEQYNLRILDEQIARYAAPVNRLTGTVAYWNSQVLGFAADIARVLGEDQICTPGICLTPCYYPGWCSRSCGFFTCSYPCPRSCGCAIRAPEICVPNPIAKAIAASIGQGPLKNAQQRFTNATRALDRAQQRLSQVSSPREALLAALATAEDAVTVANSELGIAQQNLNDIIQNSGPLADIAEFILDNTLNKSVATTKAIFTTTIASAESGSYTGDLSITASILSLPPQTITIPQFKITGNGIESSLTAAMDAIINSID